MHWRSVPLLSNRGRRWNSCTCTSEPSFEYQRFAKADPSCAFSSVPDAQSARKVSRIYSTRPHVAGSLGDYLAALDILELFQTELGIAPPPKTPVFPAGSPASRAATLGIGSLTKPNAWIDTYYPLMNTPLDRALSIVDQNGSALWEADLVEHGDPRDPGTVNYQDVVPTFHGFSADGDVEGPLIYVNYGLKADYDEVLAAGGNFTGKVVLARYGGNARGLKARFLFSTYVCIFLTHACTGASCGRARCSRRNYVFRPTRRRPSHSCERVRGIP